MIAIQTNQLSNHPHAQNRGTIHLQHNQQHENRLKNLITNYVTICANESISYFNDYFLNIIQIEKYYLKLRPLTYSTTHNCNNNTTNNIHIHGNHNNTSLFNTHNNTNNIISLLIPTLFSYVEQHYKSVATELNTTYKHLSFKTDEVTHFLFTKFVKNCMECIINNNSKSFVLLPKVIFENKYNLSNISNQFEMILTTLCHRNGIMAPIKLPTFNITKYNMNTIQHNKQQQQHLQQQQQQQQQHIHMHNIQQHCHHSPQINQVQVQPTHTTHITHSHSHINNNNNRIFQPIPLYNYYTKPIQNVRYINNRYKQRIIAQKYRINSIRNNINNNNNNSANNRQHPIPIPLIRHSHSIPNDFNSVLSKYLSTSLTSDSDSKLKYGEAKLIKINATISSEYKKISKRFLNETRTSGLNLKIINLYKIRNDKLFDDYKYRKESILRGLDNNINKLNEKYLYHGTNITVIPKIITQGFLRQFTTRHAFGQGCYFAVNSSYSTHPRYSMPNNSGIQFVFVCNVVCGEYCKGNSNMKVPNVKPNTNNILYETTCNDIKNPTVFVTFNDNQAIPIYLIAFRNQNLNSNR